MDAVGDVATRFELAVSTLHYWERRGLIAPQRRGGRRYYDDEQQYRVALIQGWQAKGRLSLEEIAGLLTGPGWRDGVRARLAEVEAEMAELTSVREYLYCLLRCTRDHPAQDCTALRSWYGG
ncbi:MerR family transcriptional regulator [Pseudonocardiaceae bacterium YIM PH 21723]|nr:MerR family transcriptional regulator [Pseudonocardiaceae bacterium YIM PH 21723]